MRAQMQRVSTNPEKEGEVLEVFEQLRAIEQEDSGLLQTLVLRSQTDPTEVFVFVVFESEEKARARDKDPRRQEGTCLQECFRVLLGHGAGAL